MKKFYITTPIYYVNDQPHIGHAYTTAISDSLARYYRLKLGADNVWFLTGTDEHGAKVEQAANKNQQKPQEFCNQVSAKFQISWDSLNVSNNDFLRTTEKRHEDSVKNILLKLKDLKTPKGNDIFFEKDYEGLYCVGCEAYVKEDDLVDGLCPDHMKKPELVKEKNWFFRLSDYEDILKEQIEKNILMVEPKKRQNEVLGLLDQGLEDIAISRTKVEWGIRVPWDEKQTVYVWVEALMNYITSLGYLSDDEKKLDKFWPADLQVIGKDILKFHAVIWPALLITLGLKIPDKIFAHGYFTIDGKKMSKTLGNAIDPNDLIDKFGSEGARYLIMSQFPFGEDGDIKADLFEEKFNADLANGIGNLVSRILSMNEKYFDNVIPEASQNEDIFKIKKVWKSFTSKFEQLKIFEAIKDINALTQKIDKYIADNKPWDLAKDKGNEKKLSQIVYNLCEGTRHLAWMIYPILPETSMKIFKKLNLQKELQEIKFEKAQKWGLLKSGTKIEKGEALFPRIEK